MEVETSTACDAFLSESLGAHQKQPESVTVLIAVECDAEAISTRDRPAVAVAVPREVRHRPSGGRDTIDLAHVALVVVDEERSAVGRPGTRVAASDAAGGSAGRGHDVR